MKWPQFDPDEIEAVNAVLRSGLVNYWTGTEGRKFEQEFAVYCGARRAIALANGTVALELALRALGIGPGDDVVVTARSFFASASCIVACGARPVFADVDRNSQNVTVETIEAVTTSRTRAVVAVHLAGWPCDVPAILEFCRSRGILVLEDCAQAHGAAIQGRRVGSFGDAAAFSFCNDKIMSTGGEGGMVTANDEAIWRSVWSLKDHGKSWDLVQRNDFAPGFRWLHERFGTNGRLTEMQSAIGRIQLRKIDRWLEQRRKNADHLFALLSNAPALRLPRPGPELRHAWYKFYCFIETDALRQSWSRDRVLAEVNERGAECYSGSCPEIYLEKAFDGSDARPPARLDVARELGETSLMLPVDPCQNSDDLDRNAQAVVQVIKKALR